MGFFCGFAAWGSSSLDPVKMRDSSQSGGTCWQGGESAAWRQAQMLIDSAVSVENDSHILLATDGHSWDSAAHASIKSQIE